MHDKARLETSLETARTLVKTYFEVEGCQWEKRFYAERQECRGCADRHVCEWLFHQDTAVDLSSASPEQLRDVLAFAADYLQGQMLKADHEIFDCLCASCAWVRETDALLRTD